ncbi:hypothetical protein GMDG_08803, partial [Pseudogymnoascus destructans 20631-21]
IVFFSRVSWKMNKLCPPVWVRLRLVITLLIMERNSLLPVKCYATLNFRVR